MLAVTCCVTLANGLTFDPFFAPIKIGIFTGWFEGKQPYRMCKCLREGLGKGRSRSGQQLLACGSLIKFVEKHKGKRELLLDKAYCNPGEASQ